MSLAPLLGGLFIAALLTADAATAPPRPQVAPPQHPVSVEQLQASIDKLGALDYAARANASKVVRRAPQAQAVAALIQAATGHTDGFVRFRSLVLLTGFPDPRVKDLMGEFLGDPNDRLRQVAYRFFEHNPDTSVVPTLIAGIEKERSEFVRPALVRAIAAVAGADTRARAVLEKELDAGRPLRSAVVEALGDYRASYAKDRLVSLAKAGGPAAEEAVLAIGKLQDKTLLPVLAGLQETAPADLQPQVAAAICLLGVNCSSHLGYLERVLRFAEKTPGYQPLVRGAAKGLGAVATGRSEEALALLIDIGASSAQPVRAPLVLALGTAALRRPESLLGALERRPEADRARAVGLLSEAFDMLEEDYAKEQFFTTARAAYWKATDGSATRRLIQSLFDELDF